MSTLPSWLEPSWRALTGRDAKLAHALLLSGPGGLGKRLLADALLARLLCTVASGVSPACGECAGCRLRVAGNHPDALLLAPPEAQAGEDDNGERPASRGSGQILIEQVRALQSALELTASMHGRRVVVIEPAEAMNAYTANALLKLLEEPPRDTHLILVSSAPRRLLPTLRSRCQQWPVPMPGEVEARAWLEAQGEHEAGGLLALVGGAPLAAVRLAGQGGAKAAARFVADVGRLSGGDDPVALAGRWEHWAKSKEGGAAGIGMPRLADWMQRWVWDLVASRCGAPCRYFPRSGEMIRALVEGLPVGGLFDCYNELERAHRSANHPLNLRLALEDMLLRYRRGISRSR